jgi:hypothetical protein
MSIDYTAYHGIGYKVYENDELLEDEEVLEDGLQEYIENNISDGFSVFETNRGYDTESDATYLIIDNPFSYGLDLNLIKDRLHAEMKKLGVETADNLDVVGGMRVW